MEFERRLGPYLSCHGEPTYEYGKPCGSWLYSPKSNIHITRDREWFEDDYMAFSSIIYHARHKPWDNVKELTNPCAGEIRDNTGYRVTHFLELTSPMQHIEVRLCGPPFGRETKQRSPFHPEVKHDIRAKWPASERLRFELYRSTRDPSVDIGEKPWLEEELQSIKNDGHDPDEFFETFKKQYAEKGPQYAKKADSGLMMTILRGKVRALWLKNPFQEHFDYHMGYCESDECEWAFSAAQIDFVSQSWRNTKDFMDMFGYKSACEDDCMMAAMQVKDLMREEGLEVSSEDDMDEDGSGWEDTDEDMCECEHDKCECIDGVD